MNSRNQYLYSLICNNGGYHLKSKKQKSKILDQYCQNTGQNRKYIIRKIRNGNYIVQERKRKNGKQRKRKSFYDRHVVSALIRCWEIFDYPCGQRLESLLSNEIDRLRKDKELICFDIIAEKLKKLQPAPLMKNLNPTKKKRNLNVSTITKIIPCFIKKYL